MSEKIVKTINIVFFYLIWWGTILGIRSNFDYIGPALTFLFIIVHLNIISKVKKEVILVLCCAALGLIVESFYLYFSFISYQGYLISNSSIPPLWIVCIWMTIALTINHSMFFLKGKWALIVICGIIFGPICYFAAMKSGIIHFYFPTKTSIFILSFICAVNFSLMYFINKIIEDKYGI